MADKTQANQTATVAHIPEALKFAGVKSRTTLITWERQGIFPKRVKIGNGVGYLWADLHQWAESLQPVEKKAE